MSPQMVTTRLTMLLVVLLAVIFVNCQKPFVQEDHETGVMKQIASATIAMRCGKKYPQFGFLYLATVHAPEIEIYIGNNRYTRDNLSKLHHSLMNRKDKVATYPISPTDEKLRNFVAITVKDKSKLEDHVEYVALNKFLIPMLAANPAVRDIYLYTYIIPCDKCNETIFDAADAIQDSRLYVGYTNHLSVSPGWKENISADLQRALSSTGGRLLYIEGIPKGKQCSMPTMAATTDTATDSEVEQRFHESMFNMTI